MQKKEKTRPKKYCMYKRHKAKMANVGVAQCPLAPPPPLA